jgi:hypothetical protein
MLSMLKGHKVVYQFIWPIGLPAQPALAAFYGLIHIQAGVKAGNRSGILQVRRDIPPSSLLGHSHLILFLFA